MAENRNKQYRQTIDKVDDEANEIRNKFREVLEKIEELRKELKILREIRNDMQANYLVESEKRKKVSQINARENSLPKKKEQEIKKIKELEKKIKELEKKIKEHDKLEVDDSIS